jgi:Helicase conserved C-terminal domain
VLLTATPDAADDPLSQIGALDPIESAAVLFRRTRANVQDCTPRRSAFLRITPTAAERRMHDLLERYTRQIWRESVARGDARAKLVTIVLRKRALSSAGSLALSVERRLELMTAASAPAERQLLLPLADEDPLSDAMQDDDLAAPGLADVRKERRWLGAIAEAARDAARAESKAVRLLRWLARVHEPVIVFTEYRDTLRALERLIRATGRPLTTLHGGLERADRVRAQAIFNAGGVSLLATDAAAEGLNLHHHCRIVLHYELPWRPSRIEQRAGRVDRLGQSRRVHEIALVAAGTAERLVLAPLVSRAARARAVGDTAGGLLDSLSESTVSDLIIGGVPLPAAPGVRDSTERTADLRAEAIAEVVRLETIRRSVSESPEPGLRRRETKTVIVTAMKGRRSSFGRGLVLVFAQTLTDRVGRRVHSEPLVLFVTLVKRAEWGHRESLRRLVLEIDSLARHSETAIGRLRDADLTQIASRIVPLHDGACDALHRREELMRHRLPSAATQMVQAGLFDRRALSNSMRRKEVREAQIEVLEATGQAIERSTSLVPATHLAAVLLVC